MLRSQRAPGHVMTTELLSCSVPGGSQPLWKRGNVRANEPHQKSDLEYKATGSRCTRIRARAHARARQLLLSQEPVECSGNSRAAAMKALTPDTIRRTSELVKLSTGTRDVLSKSSTQTAFGSLGTELGRSTRRIS